ncbi:MAG: DUF1566 domain-containing protein [Campylobacterales bacterium]
MRPYLALITLALASWAQTPLPGLFSYEEAKAACTARQARLPEASELYRLFDGTIGTPTLFWSATRSSEPGSQAALAVAWKAGEIMPRPMSDRLSVLCTTLPPAKPLANRFKELPTGIADNMLHALWEKKSPQTRRQRYTYQQATTYCQSLGTGWRLPTVAELYSLVDHTQFSPATDKNFFGDTIPRYYWSATTAGEFSNEAFVVGFKIGSVAASSQENESFVRCIKEGL